MEALKSSPITSINIPTSHGKPRLKKPNGLYFQLGQVPSGSSFLRIGTQSSRSISKIFTTTSPSPSFLSDSQEAFQERSDGEEEKFEWYGEWYPIVPVCDLDKRMPHAKKVIGVDLVVWWDKKEGSWKVFDDACPHRLAPLSQGRIDPWGRLQCVYHGWCFNGSGHCKYIPQAPLDGPSVQTSKKACVGVYPSVVHQDILWFWPNTDPQYKDIILEKKPPSIPELDDPSFTRPTTVRDIPYGYEVLIENLMDPAHVPYAHYGLALDDFFSRFKVKQGGQPQDEMTDRENGKPIKMSIKKLDKDGFFAKQEWGYGKFMAPCLFYSRSTIPLPDQQASGGGKSSIQEAKEVKERVALIIFYCIPVSPGNSRVISIFPSNYASWIEKIMPRWIFHLGPNIILDSDLILLHLEERRIRELGMSNWQKTCYVPTTADALVVGYRKWLKMYAGGEVDWNGKYTGDLPPTPPREQLMDRYWTHTVICPSCNSAYKCLNALEFILQAISIISIGVVAATKEGGFMTSSVRNKMVIMAILCFFASRWLANFIHKAFHFHDYNHALL